MSKRINSRLIRYELNGIIKNWYVPFFGLAFPTGLAFLIGKYALQKIPPAVLPEVRLTLVMSQLIIITLSIFLLGHGLVYAMETEKNIPIRLELFGFHQIAMIKARAIAQLIIFCFCVSVFLTATGLGLDLPLPTTGGLIGILTYTMVTGLISFILAHAIALIIGKFSATYAVLMCIYFAFMIAGGGMGIPFDDMPAFIRIIAEQTPFPFFYTHFADIWQGKVVSAAPAIQGLLVYAAITFLILLFALRKRKLRSV
ncbi:MAG: hypothetical protein Q4P30_02285 [Eubacteriales bacterium]|nr:hypothetical protein [Eubacteriales bacterium]